MENAWLIPFLPFLAFALIGLFLKPAKRLSSFVAIVAILTSFVLAILINLGIFQNPDLIEHPIVKSIRWFTLGDNFSINVGTLLDPISGMMLFVVTLVASLVQIYSVGYMHGDPSYSRFFAYLSLFAMAMLGLVLSSNLLQMFVFWELVGLASYLLIGFWYYKPAAREAAKKAFITTRVGDFGLLLGILFLQIYFGSLDFQFLAEKIPLFEAKGLLAVIAVLIFVGPIGKSGQFPLHVWLPDAMEGPTPVSALIHAATMVVAGVYLIARFFILFVTAESAMAVIAWIGGFTALFAATIAITQREMKRVLAYSTVSQIGYMMLALGVGSLTASMFHLMTHAFFKALMFLGAGSVLHALHGTTDIFEMGGLKKKMPITTWTFVIGVLAIAGIPPLAGFWSKDEILLATSHYSIVLTIMATITAFLTAFYMSRLLFVVFFGKENPHNHPHESPFSMVLPLVILAFLSIVGGLVGTPWTEHGFGYWIHFGEFEHEAPSFMIMGISTVVAVCGMFLAYLIYNRKSISNVEIARRFPLLYKISFNKYFIDEIYLWLTNNVLYAGGQVLYWVDLYIVDGIVNGLAWLTRWLGSVFRYFQTGQLQNYALVLFAALILFFIIIALGGQASVNLVFGGGQ